MLSGRGGAEELKSRSRVSIDSQLVAEGPAESMAPGGLQTFEVSFHVYWALRSVFLTFRARFPRF